LVFRQGHDAVHAVHLYDSDGHFDGEKHSRTAREKSENQKWTTKSFQHSRNVNQLCRQSVLREHSLHRGVGMGELWIAVFKENRAENAAQNQQAQGLQGIQEFQESLPRENGSSIKQKDFSLVRREYKMPAWQFKKVGPARRKAAMVCSAGGVS
jgi:hypothetical protein